MVYIPWFVTDEIDPKNPEDGKAFYNMRYYVTVPGIIHADCTIVQSEGMKKAYLAKLSRFIEEKDVLERLEKKILGAGSFLTEEKNEKEKEELLNKVLSAIFPE